MRMQSEAFPLADEIRSRINKIRDLYGVETSVEISINVGQDGNHTLMILYFKGVPISNLVPQQFIATPKEVSGKILPILNSLLK